MTTAQTFFRVRAQITFHDRDIDNYDRSRVTNNVTLSAPTLEGITNEMAAFFCANETRPNDDDEYYYVNFGNIEQVTIHETIDSRKLDLTKTPAWAEFIDEQHAEALVLHQEYKRQEEAAARQVREAELAKLQDLMAKYPELLANAQSERN